jgi:hypothetical protein
MADGNDKITAFDKAHYEQLLAYLMSVEKDVDINPRRLGPSADLKLDSTLTTRFHPGSQDWLSAKNFLDKSGVFGNSVHTRLANFETDIRTFYTALKNAEEIFNKTDDLATYEASEFGQDYPDVTGNGSST